MLTHKQKDLLLLIHDCTKDGGVPPSFEEMKEQLGLKSKSGIHRLITGLEERGYIRRLPNKARALEVTKLPQDVPTAAKTEPGNLVRIPGAQPYQASMTAGDTVHLPLYGRIAAGMPIDAIADQSRTLEVPPSMVSGGDHYALEVYGDSMIEAGIHDGDIAIIKKADQVNNGDIAVCLIEDEDATLKFFRRDQGVVTLTPANRQHQTQVYPANSVRVQGRLSSLMRQY